MREQGRAAIAAIIAIIALAAGALAFYKVRGDRGETSTLTGSGAVAAVAQLAGVARGGGGGIAIETALGALPADASLVATIPDFRGYAEGLANTDFGRLLEDPEVQKRAETAAHSLGDENAVARLRAAAAGLAAHRELGIRAITFGLFPVPGDRPLGLGGVIQCDSDDDAEQLAIQIASREGIQTTGTAGDLAYTCQDELCSARTGATIYVGSPLSALVRMTQNAGLGLPPRLAEVLTATEVEPAGLFLFADARELVTVAMSAAGGSPETDDLLSALGFGGFDYLTLTARNDGRRSRSRIDIRYEAAQTGLIGALMETPTRPPTLDQRLPGDLEAVSFGHMNDPAATYDRMLETMRSVTPAAERESFDQGLAMVNGLLGIDLRNDLFAAFGGEMGIAYDTPKLDQQNPEAMLESLRMVFVAGVVAPAKLEALLAKLEPFAAMQGAPIEKVPVGDGTMRLLPIPGSAAPAALAIADGMLVLGTRAADVRGLFDGSLSPLSKDEDYRELRDALPGDAGGWSFQRANVMQMRPLFEAVLNGGGANGEIQQSYADLSTLSTAIEAYKADNGVLPDANSIAELTASLTPTYARELPAVDAWGAPYGFARDGQDYVFWSHGADSKAEADWSACAAGCTEAIAQNTEPTEDLVIASGQFVRWPADDLERERELPAEVGEFAEYLDRRLAELPASMMVYRTTETGCVYEGLSSVDVGVAATTALLSLAGS